MKGESTMSIGANTMLPTERFSVSGPACAGLAAPSASSSAAAKNAPRAEEGRAWLMNGTSAAEATRRSRPMSSNCGKLHGRTAWHAPRDADTLARADRAMRHALPIVAIVGRPNVGKSTLFNRFAGARRALVEDRPGITRDRIAEEVALPGGRRALVVDTAGLDPEAEAGLPAAVQAQARA